MPGLNIKKDDEVEVLAGKDRGKRGRVVRVWPGENKVMIAGVNQVKRHEKIRMATGRAGTEGGIITKEMPINVSNVGIVCPDCDRPVRIGFEEDAEGKYRVCRRCGRRLGLVGRPR
jgi:large subunit ribosomal protein L24